MAASTPLVFCETNWLVELAFPHRQHHQAAKALLAAAEAGTCALEVPLTAMLEARRPLKKVKDDLVNDLSTLKDRLASATRQGFPALSKVVAALDSQAVQDYVDREPPRVLDEVGRAPGVEVLSDVPDMLRTVEEIRLAVPFHGRDVVDLHVLATVLAYRRRHPGPAAILMSTDTRAFGRGDVADLCARERLLLRHDFALGEALREWQGRFGS